MEEKPQVILIRGGEAFDNKEEFYNYLKNKKLKIAEKKRWTGRFVDTLGNDFEAFEPKMPNKQWADYEAWKIWFEKYFNLLNNNKNLILVGSSLGGLFLAKYLSENKFPRQINQLHFVSPVFDNEGLIDETTTTFELNTDKLKNIKSQVDKIFFYHSTDDNLVPFAHSLKYLEYISEAKLFRFENRGHFRQPVFLEILEVINENLK